MDGWVKMWVRTEMGWKAAPVKCAGVGLRCAPRILCLVGISGACVHAQQGPPDRLAFTLISYSQNLHAKHLHQERCKPAGMAAVRGSSVPKTGGLACILAGKADMRGSVPWSGLTACFPQNAVGTLSHRCQYGGSYYGCRASLAVT